MKHRRFENYAFLLKKLFISYPQNQKKYNPLKKHQYFS